MKVFLGGTVNDSKWRDEIIPKLKVDYFNPVVEYWDEAAQQRELHERETADFNLYVLSPRMEGFYSIAEVADDSFKKADKTIFCYLKEDGDKKFTDHQLLALERLGKMVTANGGLWKSSLNEVVNFLNSAHDTAADAQNARSDFKQVFISYGRRHSLAFARKLYYNLNNKGYKVWFDMNDIPIGVDFQEQIDEGIRKADNFIFVISPHSVNSIYCYKEIVLAKKYNKRIIPILHVEPEGLWNKMHPDISKLNWIYSRQIENFDIPIEEWEDVDDFRAAFDNLDTLLNQDSDHVEMHTLLLDKALSWVKNQKSPHLLLSGFERKKAMQWMLKRDFKDTYGQWRQTPVTPTELHAEYITESQKFAQNLATDCFIAYDREDKETKDLIKSQLSLNGVTTWTDTTDIKKGTRFKDAIDKGVAEATNVIFLISPNSVNSKVSLQELDLAFKYKKRVIPLLIEPTSVDELPIKIRSIQYIDFTNRQEKQEVEIKDQSDVEAEVEARKEASPLQKSMNELLSQIKDNEYYYSLHKLYLAQALKWEKHNKPNSMLLRASDLETAETWLKLSETQNHKTNNWQKDYINASRLAIGTIDFDVYIIGSVADEDFTQKLNSSLQIAGKTTWFGLNAVPDKQTEEEIENGIFQCDNILVAKSFDSDKDEAFQSKLKLALELNKRIIAVKIQHDDNKNVTIDFDHYELINFIDNDFSSAFTDIISALDTDREHIRQHSQISREAKKWESHSKSNDYLLRGKELDLAIEWLETADLLKKQPEPTALQREFLDRGNQLLIVQLQKEATQRRIKRLFIFAIFTGIFAFLLAILAYKGYRDSEVQRKIAEKQTIIATENAKIAAENEKKAKQLADSANVQRENALIQKQLAERQKQIALEQKNAAEKARREAEVAKAEALFQKQIAEALKEEAIYLRDDALSQKEIAERAEQKAQYYLYAFNAKNMANEALSSNKIEVQSFLATTALELYKHGDSLANIFDLKNPYIASIHQALQVNFNQLKFNRIVAGQSKSVIAIGDKLFFAKEEGGLAYTQFISSNTNLIKFNPAVDVSDKNIGIVYSMQNLQDKIFFNTSKGELFMFDMKSTTKIEAPFSGLVRDVNKLPNPNELLITLTNGNSTVFSYEQFLAGKYKNTNLLEGRRIGSLLLKKINTSFNWDSLNLSSDVMCFSQLKSSVLSDTGTGKILKTSPHSVEEFPQGHTGLISDMCITKNANQNSNQANKAVWVASSSFDGSIMIWRLGDETETISGLLPITIYPKNAKYINSVTFSDDGKYLFYSDNNGIGYILMDLHLLYQEILNSNSIPEKTQNKWWEYYKRGDIEKPQNIN